MVCIGDVDVLYARVTLPHPLMPLDAIRRGHALNKPRSERQDSCHKGEI
jgi:hypothetical protein